MAAPSAALKQPATRSTLPWLQPRRGTFEVRRGGQVYVSLQVRPAALLYQTNAADECAC